MDTFYLVLQKLPAWLAASLAQVPSKIASQIHEIRLREGAPISLTVAGVQKPLSAVLPENAFIQSDVVQEPLTALSLAQIEETLFVLCEGSIYTHAQELAQGFVTISGGHRVGVGGKYIQNHAGLWQLQMARSLNIRIARTYEMELPTKLKEIFSRRFTGFLILGEPDSGKTTYLRNVTRCISKMNRAVVVIDEREELFPMNTTTALEYTATHPHFSKNYKKDDIDCTSYWDVLSGIQKSDAIQMALRTLSPSVIVLDELGTLDELTALAQGFFAGVDFVASLHAASFAEAEQKPQFQYLRTHGMLCAACLLKGRTAPGEIVEIKEYV